MKKHESNLTRRLGIIAGVCKETRPVELIDPHANKGAIKFPWVKR